MATKYLSTEQLVGFDNYKYSSKDTSPLSNYVMHPFWDQTVKLVPRWVAPNLLTFTGFLMTVANGLLLAYYDYYFYASDDTHPEYEPVPSWVWIVCAIFHFLSHTLDGIDGKQARRTGSSGPVGELMDHGVDSWATLFLPTVLYSCFSRDEFGFRPHRAFYLLWCVHFCFMISHWEKYNTGVLYLPWSYDIAELIGFLCLTFTYFKSYKLWKFKIPVLNLSPALLLELVIYCGAIFLTIPMTVKNLYSAYRQNKLQQPNVVEAVRPLVPITILFILTLIWVTYSPSNILEKNPRLFYWMVGTVFSNITCRLIVSQMTHTRCEAFSWILLPVVFAMCVTFWYGPNLSVEIYSLRILTVFVLGAHLHYGICVVMQLCDHFNIYCFKLRQERSII